MEALIVVLVVATALIIIGIWMNEIKDEVYAEAPPVVSKGVYDRTTYEHFLNVMQWLSSYNYCLNEQVLTGNELASRLLQNLELHSRHLIISIENIDNPEQLEFLLNYPLFKLTEHGGDVELIDELRVRLELRLRYLEKGKNNA